MFFFSSITQLTSQLSIHGLIVAENVGQLSHGGLQTDRPRGGGAEAVVAALPTPPLPLLPKVL